MGAFNTVRGVASCPRCGCEQTFIVQFKFGDVWQREYRLGDTLLWGGNDVGSPGWKKVIVDGIGEDSCRCCGEQFLPFHLIVERDRILKMMPGSGGYDFKRQDFLLIEA